jgi:hypothetical protein
MSIISIWDLEKAKSNIKKHNVSFEEAESVFEDLLARIKPDPDHSKLEQRYLIQGYSDKNRLLVVSFTDINDIIRIISARKSTNKEKKQYEEFI